MMGELFRLTFNWIPEEATTYGIVISTPLAIRWLILPRVPCIFGVDILPTRILSGSFQLACQLDLLEGLVSIEIFSLVMLELLDGERLIDIVSFLERLVKLLLQVRIVGISLLGPLKSTLILSESLGISVPWTGTEQTLTRLVLQASSHIFIASFKLVIASF